MSALPNTDQDKPREAVQEGPCQMALKPRLGRLLIVVLACFELIQLSGCCSSPMGNGGMLMDKMFVGYRDRVWAARAYNEQFGGHHSLFTNHHRRGYMDGYCSVCRGGDGYVPAVPPRDYWSSQYQSEYGSVCVNDWFNGYPEGSAAAATDNAGRYNNVYISQMLDAAITQEKNGSSLPSDIRVIQGEVQQDPLIDIDDSLSGQGDDANGPLEVPGRDWSKTFPGSRSSNSADSAPPLPIVR